jgi:hypothetical protein
MTEYGGGKERKMNGEAPMANQVRDGKMVERAEVKVFAKRQLYKKLFKHSTSPKSLAPVIDAFWKSCIHNSYIEF